MAVEEELVLADAPSIASEERSAELVTVESRTLSELPLLVSGRLVFGGEWGEPALLAPPQGAPLEAFESRLGELESWASGVDLESLERRMDQLEPEQSRAATGVLDLERDFANLNERSALSGF